MLTTYIDTYTQAYASTNANPILKESSKSFFLYLCIANMRDRFVAQSVLPVNDEYLIGNVILIIFI